MYGCDLPTVMRSVRDSYWSRDYRKGTGTRVFLTENPGSFQNQLKTRRLYHVLLVKRNQRNSVLMSLRPIKYLICCFSKGRLSSPSYMPYNLQRSWRGWNIASGTMQHLTTPMITRSSDSRSNRLLSKEDLNLKLLPKLKSRWRLINTHF
jgi:hypothetical protein